MVKTRIMKPIYKYLIAGIILALIIILFIRSLFMPTPFCTDLNIFKATSYRGIVIQKFVDLRNSNAKMIKVATQKDTFDLIVSRDTSNFFHYVIENDSLIKEAGSDMISVQTESSIKEFRIFFACE
jgi:hypothetical protein